MDETLNFSHVFGTEPLFEMISDSGLSCKTKDKSDTRAPHKINSYLDGEEQRSVYWYQYNTSSDRDSPSPSSYHSTFGHKRGRTGIKCWVREDRECVWEIKEINITSAGCWAGQLVDNECVPLQSGNKRLLLTPASTSRSPVHLIILQSNAHTHNSQQSSLTFNLKCRCIQSISKYPGVNLFKGVNDG